MRAALAFCVVLLMLPTPARAQVDEGGARIRGVVLNEDGDPVPYAFVWVGTPDVVDVARVYADGEGRYDRAGLAPMCYVLRVQAGDPRESRLRGNDTTAHEPCRALGAGDQTWWNVTLDFVPLVKGFVVDERGQPAIHRRVSLAGSGQGAMEANGSYRVVAEQGVYEYYVDAVDSAMGRSFFHRCAGPGDPQCVAVPARGDVWLNLTVPWLPLTELSVKRPEGTLVTSATVTLVERATGERTQWYTQLEGVSRVLVPPGSYDATIRVGYDPRAPELPVCAEQPCLVVPDHDTRQVLVLRGAGAFHVRGHVTRADGTPIDGARIHVDDAFAEPYALTAPNGSYDIIVPEGAHTIGARWPDPPRESDFESIYSYARCDRPGSGCFEVDVRADATIDFVLPRLGRVAVTVDDAGGGPFRHGALVSLWNAEHVFGDRTDEEGRVAGTLPVGNYSLDVDPPYEEAPGAQWSCIACLTIEEGHTTQARALIAPGVVLHFGTEDRADDDTSRGVSAFVPDDRSLSIATGFEFPVFYLNAPVVPGALMAFSDVREGALIGGWREMDLSQGAPQVRPINMGPRTIVGRAEVPGLAAFLVRTPDNDVLLVARADDPFLSNATVVVDGLETLASASEGYVLARAPNGVEGREWRVVVRNATDMMEATLTAGEPVVPPRATPDAGASSTPVGWGLAGLAIACAALARRARR